MQRSLPLPRRRPVHRRPRRATGREDRAARRGTYLRRGAGARASCDRANRRRMSSPSWCRVPASGSRRSAQRRRGRTSPCSRSRGRTRSGPGPARSRRHQQALACPAGGLELRVVLDVGREHRTLAREVRVRQVVAVLAHARHVLGDRSCAKAGRGSRRRAAAGSRTARRKPGRPPAASGCWRTRRPPKNPPRGVVPVPVVPVPVVPVPVVPVPVPPLGGAPPGRRHREPPVDAPAT